MRFAFRRFVQMGVLLALVSTAQGQDARDAGIFRVGTPGIVAPKLRKDVRPKYTRDAMAAGIQGTVSLEALVLTNGKVGKVSVTKSLDPKYGLDAEAVKTVKKWRFTPGTKDGEPVPVIVEIEMSFELRKR